MNEQQEISGGAQAEQTAQPRTDKPQATTKRSGWFMTGVKVTFATHAWRKQAAILKRRGSFPLLRQVLKNSTMTNKVMIPTELIADEYVDKSIVGHKIMMASFVVTFFYFLYLFIKGLAVAIEFGAPLNLWLIMSVPMMIYCGLRYRLSSKVLTAFVIEKEKRIDGQQEEGASINVAS